MRDALLEHELLDDRLGLRLERTAGEVTFRNAGSWLHDRAATGSITRYAPGCLPGGTRGVLPFASDFDRLSARFSFRDLLAFLDMCCRGDLSAMGYSL
jgi:hypothetical protein